MYCPKCGGTGVLIDGTPCTCKVTESELYVGVECFDVPEAYRGIHFDSIILPGKFGDVYRNTMKNYYEQISSLRWKCHNLLVCAESQSGKTVFAYSALQELFRKDIDVFPIFDVLELRRIMQDIEYGRDSSLGVSEPQRLYEVPYLFAMVPPLTINDTYSAIAMLVARRVRRGGSTILFYSGTWNQLVIGDVRGILKSMKGDGSLTTIEVSSWQKKEEIT